MSMYLSLSLSIYIYMTYTYDFVHHTSTREHDGASTMVVSGAIPISGASTMVVPMHDV